MLERILEPDFAGTIGRTVDDSTPWWPEAKRPPADAPNIIVIVLDDVGFAQLGCYGSDIRTPNIDALAEEGVRHAGFHVTPLCSPTRACLLTGRNHHSVGMGMIAGFPSGYPSGRERVSHSAAMVSAALKTAGYGTYAVGKWHLLPMNDMTPAGPFDHWPLAHGFDRFYGFLGGETDQYRPNLHVDNQVAVPPDDPDYHLSEDLVDQATKMLSSHRSAAPDRPFFMYFAFGACHGPHQVPEPYRSKYRGAYDDGWDAVRSRWYERQLELGIIPSGTELAPRNPDVAPWDAMDPTDQADLARFHEVYAGFLEHTDAQVGRLLATLEHLGCADDTMVLLLSDNGAAGEGGPQGSWNELIPFNGLDDEAGSRFQPDAELGTPDTYPIYPRGWAQVGNTPLKWYKHHTHGGGVRAPLIVRWRDRLTDTGRLDRGFRHAIDLTPTMLDAAGVDMPAIVAGVPQLPLHGRSFLDALLGGPSDAEPRTQYFEMQGHRGIYHDGWKAVAKHDPGRAFDDDVWELYHLADDFSECRDLSRAEPGRLAAMRELWWHEAGRYGVTPLDDRFLERAQSREGTYHVGRSRYEYFRGTARISESAGAEVRAGAFRLSTTLAPLTPDDAGVIVSFGGRHSGFVLYVQPGRLCFDYNAYRSFTHLEADLAAPAERCEVAVRWLPDGSGATVELEVDGAVASTGSVPVSVPYYSGGHGFEIGGNWLSPVSGAYQPPFEYSGSFRSVVIETSPEGLDVRRAVEVAERAD
jgi:arylsulfatase A-like enzyme